MFYKFKAVKLWTESVNYVMILLTYSSAEASER